LLSYGTYNADMFRVRHQHDTSEGSRRHDRSGPQGCAADAARPRRRGNRMKRRDFITLLGGAAAAWPLAARAQQRSRLPTIGFLGAGTPSVEGQRVAAFVQRLRELGWIDGRDVVIECRWAEARKQR